MNRSPKQNIAHDADKDIDKILTALRNTEPPAGIERRILKALQQQAPVRSQSGWRRLAPLCLTEPLLARQTRSLGYGIALAAVIAAALTLPATRRHSPTLTRTHLSPAPPPESPRATLPGITAESALAPPTSQTTHLPRKPNRHTAAAAPDEDAIALEELHAPSLPAPPLPLTRQEKLLLRVAHKGDPEPLTVLNGDLRAKAEAEQKADFDKFFGKPDQPAASQTE